MLEPFLGHSVGGRFQAFDGVPFSSQNPHTLEPVCEASASVAAVGAAVAAAQAALPAWRRLPVEARIEALRGLVRALPDHVERLAEAITAEMGKPRGEALIEARGVGAKLDDTVALLPHELAPAHPRAPGQQRHRPLGVVAVVGPFNFPVHLINTHLLPALLAGNTVVAKASEVTPLTGQRYAELFHAAGLPPGVFNLVQGGGPVGEALVTHPDVRGVVFTGSYATARRIRQALFDHPEKKLALELGGKNAAVVLDDAALDHTVREILLGALLTTGQRCTATSRVICSPGVAGPLTERLVEAFSKIRPADPRLDSTFLGPLATQASVRNFFAGLAEAREQGAEVLVESEALGACRVTPSLYRVQGNERLVNHELFGPNVALEVARDEDDAITRASHSPYGLSGAIFTERAERFEDFADRVDVGVINWNRSTNGASGLLPFGGLGMSGNHHPGGSGSLRIGTFPVAVMSVPSTARTPNAALDVALAGASGG